MGQADIRRSCSGPGSLREVSKAMSNAELSVSSIGDPHHRPAEYPPRTRGRAGGSRTTILALALTVAMAIPAPHAALAASPAAATTSTPGHQAPPANRSLLTSGEWCAQYRPGHLSDEARLAGGNRRRLAAAQAALAPGFTAGRTGDGLRLLADYQAIMETRKPDRVLAATYLAVASAVPVDLRMVERVNRLLCVTASSPVARGIATIANAEWRDMSR
jgi:hypothetical protein